jgi:hypothetical protein
MVRKKSCLTRERNRAQWRAVDASAAQKHAKAFCEVSVEKHLPRLAGELSLESAKDADHEEQSLGAES